MARALLLAAASLAIAGPALAGQPVTLRVDTTSAGPVVTLGDLFDGAGARARVPIASRSGDSVVLNARIVQLAAARAGLDWANAEGLKTIVVRGGPGGFAPGAVAGPARGNVQVLAYARDIAAGEVLRAEDVIWAKSAAAPADAARDPDMVIGMTARRPLRAGAAALARDVSAPILIKAGEMVAVSFEADGISLSLQGKALGAGALGESLSVENLASKKTIQAIVTGPGLAAVGPQAEVLRTARSARFAAR